MTTGAAPGAREANRHIFIYTGAPPSTSARLKANKYIILYTYNNILLYNDMCYTECLNKCLIVRIEEIYLPYHFGYSYPRFTEFSSPVPPPHAIGQNDTSNSNTTISINMNTNNAFCAVAYNIMQLVKHFQKVYHMFLCDKPNSFVLKNC